MDLLEKLSGQYDAIYDGVTKLIADTDTAEAMADELEKAKYYQG